MDRDTIQDDQQSEDHREAIEQRSPEGRPAHPELRARGVMVAILARFALIVVVAVVAALLIGVPIAIAVLGVGVVLVAVDPTIWSAIERSREREEISRDSAQPRTEGDR